MLLIDRENADATVVTPWGRASDLRKRRLYPGSGTPPHEVSRNQRERLFGAVVAVASEKGFEATTVADLLTLSGVSRSAFYKHFAGKSECLVAAVSDLGSRAEASLESPADGGGRLAPEERLGKLLALVAAQPAASRVCFLELHAAGEVGEAIGDAALEALADRFEALLGEAKDEGELSPSLTQTLLAGMRKLVHSRLIRGEEATLPGLAPELWDWLTKVVPPPRVLEAPRRQRLGAGPAFRGYTPGERIARAVAEAVAEAGFPKTGTDAIAARSSISLSTFYAHFSDKHDAVLGALEMSGAQITALAVPAARRAAGWEEGVRVLYESIAAYFAAEPAMAHLVLVGVYGAGPRACARRDRVIDSLAQMLVAPGFADNPEAPAIAPEAIAATVYALMREQLRRGGAESIVAVVPLATYVTLVGFVGPERALEVANGRPERR